MNLFKKALSVGSGKLTSELNGIVEEINKKEQSFEKLSDEEIKTNFQNLSEKIVDSPSDIEVEAFAYIREACLLYTSPSPRDNTLSRMPSSA